MNASVNDSTRHHLVRNEIAARNTKTPTCYAGRNVCCLNGIHPGRQSPGSQSESNTRSIHDGWVVSVANCPWAENQPLITVSVGTT